MDECLIITIILVLYAMLLGLAWARANEWFNDAPAPEQMDEETRRWLNSGEG